MKRVLITGANRGIGLEFVRQLAKKNNEIFACCRNPESAEDLKQLAEKYNNIQVLKLDINEQNSVAALVQNCSGKPIDWLINNAGIYGGQSTQQLGNIDEEEFISVMTTNCLKTLKLTEALLPNIKSSTDKLIVTISSVMGSISESIGGVYSYRASKAALNCVMRALALDVMDEGIKVLLLHPGWVQTQMGGENALISTSLSVEKMLHEIESNKDNAHAECLRRFDGQNAPW